MAKQNVLVLTELFCLFTRFFYIHQWVVYTWQPKTHAGVAVVTTYCTVVYIDFSGRVHALRIAVFLRQGVFGWG